ncbi:hypothetical protein B0H21DRAFT_710230 [Amylocystis lapponica]|nr:hypothetical protein B0H21DRAFT_710230 [Amylocystis lapponica]
MTVVECTHPRLPSVSCYCLALSPPHTSLPLPLSFPTPDLSAAASVIRVLFPYVTAMANTQPGGSRIQESSPSGPGRNLSVKIKTRYLSLSDAQISAITTIYASGSDNCHVYAKSNPLDQRRVQQELTFLGLDRETRDNLESRWSIQWSTGWKSGKKGDHVRRTLYQCACGYDEIARRLREKNKQQDSNTMQTTKEIGRRVPYDYTGCLAHIEITERNLDGEITRVQGYFKHNQGCHDALMKRLPAIPLHPHVYEIAISQLQSGATITAVQTRNQEFLAQCIYHGMDDYDPKTANIRYLFLPSDHATLYRKFSHTLGIDVRHPPQHNLDDWLDPDSSNYHPNIHRAIFHYAARMEAGERLEVCISTAKMNDAAWKYTHHSQLILDGTFGVCSSRLLVFIALGVDENRKGVPLALFLFSAPTGNRATQAGYNTAILQRLLSKWKEHLTSQSPREDTVFTPFVAITDTDTKEHNALLKCWTNHRKKVLRTTSNGPQFWRDHVKTRLYAIEAQLIASLEYDSASALIQDERAVYESLHGRQRPVTVFRIPILSQSDRENKPVLGNIPSLNIRKNSNNGLPPPVPLRQDAIQWLGIFPKTGLFSRSDWLRMGIRKTVTGLNIRNNSNNVLLNDYNIFNALIGTSASREAGLKHLEYLTENWMPLPLWRSWSEWGRVAASAVLKIQVEGVISTTNHLESFNGILKRKHLRQWLHSGHRLRFDTLIVILITRVIPHIYSRRRTHQNYVDFLTKHFENVSNGVNLEALQQRLQGRRTAAATASNPGGGLCWWIADASRDQQAHDIVRLSRLEVFWRHTDLFEASCASSSSAVFMPNHQRYDIRIHRSGVASCTCADFATHGGACKHLRALRIVVDLSLASYMQPPYHYPSTPAAAEHVRTISADIRPEADCDASMTAAPVQCLPLVEECAMLQQLGQDNTTVDLAGDGSETSDNDTGASDDDGEDVCHRYRPPSVPLTPVQGMHTDSSPSGGGHHHAAITAQIQQRVAYTIARLLPSMYVLVSLLGDLPPDVLLRSRDTEEFTEVVSQPCRGTGVQCPGHHNKGIHSSYRARGDRA